MTGIPSNWVTLSCVIWVSVTDSGIFTSAEKAIGESIQWLKYYYLKKVQQKIFWLFLVIFDVEKVCLGSSACLFGCLQNYWKNCAWISMILNDLFLLEWACWPSCQHQASSTLHIFTRSSTCVSFSRTVLHRTIKRHVSCTIGTLPRASARSWDLSSQSPSAQYSIQCCNVTSQQRRRHYS